MSLYFGACTQVESAAHTVDEVTHERNRLAEEAQVRRVAVVAWADHMSAFAEPCMTCSCGSRRDAYSLVSPPFRLLLLSGLLSASGTL